MLTIMTYELLFLHKWAYTFVKDIFPLLFVYSRLKKLLS